MGQFQDVGSSRLFIHMLEEAKRCSSAYPRLAEWTGSPGGSLPSQKCYCQDGNLP